MLAVIIATCLTALISGAAAAQNERMAPAADHLADRNISPANAALAARRIRQVGVERILYGTDAAIGENFPRESEDRRQ